MKFIYSFIFIVMVSCQQEQSKDIKLINGEWEIAEVQMADGEKKQYTINEFIDYYDLNKGIRMKLKADLLGNFTSTQVTDQMLYKNELLHIITPFDTMIYEIDVLTEKQLILIDKDKNSYIYKKYEKLNLK